jgi:hypothetical protein
MLSRDWRSRSHIGPTTERLRGGNVQACYRFTVSWAQRAPNKQPFYRATKLCDPELVTYVL